MDQIQQTLTELYNAEHAYEKAFGNLNRDRLWAAVRYRVIEEGYDVHRTESITNAGTVGKPEANVGDNIINNWGAFGGGGIMLLPSLFSCIPHAVALVVSKMFTGVFAGSDDDDDSVVCSSRGDAGDSRSERDAVTISASAPDEDELFSRIVDKAVQLFKRDPAGLEHVRQLMVGLGQEGKAGRIDEILEEREKLTAQLSQGRRFDITGTYIERQEIHYGRKE